MRLLDLERGDPCTVEVTYQLPVSYPVFTWWDRLLRRRRVKAIGPPELHLRILDATGRPVIHISERDLRLLCAYGERHGLV